MPGLLLLVRSKRNTKNSIQNARLRICQEAELGLLIKRKEAEILFRYRSLWTPLLRNTLQWISQLLINKTLLRMLLLYIMNMEWRKQMRRMRTWPQMRIPLNLFHKIFNMEYMMDLFSNWNINWMESTRKLKLNRLMKRILKLSSTLISSNFFGRNSLYIKQKKKPSYTSLKTMITHMIKIITKLLNLMNLPLWWRSIMINYFPIIPNRKLNTNIN